MSSSGKAHVLLTFLTYRENIEKQKKYLNESMEKEDSQRIMSDEEYFQSQNKNSGSEIIRLIKRKLR